MINRQTIIDLVDQYLLLNQSDSFLVDVTVNKSNVIVVEIDNDKAVDIDECVAISRFIDQHMNRDEEDFELEVGSCGLTSPFKCLRQFAKYKGQNVEVLTRTGEKLKGCLGDADENGFDVTVTRKVKPEGSKKKIEVTETLHLEHQSVNAVKYALDF